MPRIYIKSNTHILEKFDKNYQIPVGASALGKFQGKADDPIKPLAEGMDGMEPLYKPKKKKQ